MSNVFARASADANRAASCSSVDRSALGENFFPFSIPMDASWNLSSVEKFEALTVSKIESRSSKYS